ncbi:uncharacterized protein LOC128243803 [Mya arenaria]|uniref:uncharacterized protein LOC128243803 n=1 Tax=Mya arenaria TaxID=6604 RepID=UPI0022E22088|nr:uncharacterized protein LOC128243803 [Mya arenaria]XP_052817713.1 uncharacterized protein LOC128243803 [Mya arenaria]XP_052817715.1 uncharacterized protein LOC128243803 [Mya arenaria]
MGERVSFDVDTQVTVLAETQTDVLLRSLECYLCNNRFADPRECDCGHVFCLQCLQTYVDETEAAGTCPRCHEDIKLPDGGPADLPVHLLYEDLTREVNGLDKENNISRGSCKFCNDEYKFPATVKCIACKVPMCENCASNHVHNGVNHVVPIHRKQDSLLCDFLPRRDTACQIHQTELLNMFCVNCQTCVCQKCKEERHANHDVSDLDKASMPYKTTINDVHDKLRDYLNETKEALNDIERIGNEYKDKVETTRKHIDDQVELLVKYILREKDRLLDDLDSHAEDIEINLDNCRSDMQTKESRARALSDLSENLMYYGNDAENTLYKSKIENRWRELREEKLSRFGQGYKMDVQFCMNDGVLALLSKELGTLVVRQNLSPWTSRKSKPFDMIPVNKGSLDDSTLQQKVRSAMSNDYSLKRSQIFAKFVNPKWTLETYKTSKATGQTVTVWLKSDEDQEGASRASKRLSMRSVSSPSIMAEIESFNEKGEHEYKKTIEKLPDGTIVRLAIGGKDTVILAVYPGVYASSIISQTKVRSLSKKDTDGIYVAVLERGNFVCGELRKIPIPEGPGFDFEITSRNTIVVRPLFQRNLRIYGTRGIEQLTDHELYESTVFKVMESPDNEIVAISRDADGNVVCESISDTAERSTIFTFQANTLNPMKSEFREARFDRAGNVLVHFQAVGAQDVLYKVTAANHRKENLSKPELLHKIDKLAILPDGRLCVFDKAECVLMTLKYL